MHLRRGRQSNRSLLLAGAAATHNADQPAILRLLLGNGKNVNESDADGNTCLHLILMSALPEQPWTVHSLTDLIRCGADPLRFNHKGLNAFDVACCSSPEFGSFQRDILLQALIEVGSDILDERLLMPTRLTTSYTALHQALVCGDSHAGADFHFRQALVNRLAFETHRPSIGPRSDLYDSSVDRVLSYSSQWNSIDADIAFSHAQLYLQRIIAVRKELKLIIEQRIPYETWMELSHLVDVRQAQTSALLEFDWFLPVDLEDIFISQIDNLIQRLETVDLGPRAVEAVCRLIQALEDAIPKSQRRSSRELRSDAPRETPPQRPQILITLNGQQTNLSDSEGSEPSSPRKESMVKTPIDFSTSRPDERFTKLPQLNVACVDPEQDWLADEQSESPRKDSMVKTPIHFYLCQLQTEDALPFSQTRRL